MWYAILYRKLTEISCEAKGSYPDKSGPLPVSLAKTWEELTMLIKEDEGIEAAVETAERLWADDRIREQILAREDYYRTMRTEQIRKQMLEDEVKKLQDQNSQLQDQNRCQQQLIDELKARLDALLPPKAAGDPETEHDA